MFTLVLKGLNTGSPGAGRVKFRFTLVKFMIKVHFGAERVVKRVKSLCLSSEGVHLVA
jgi:hypothetical protein